nr:hypothetical protein [Tanacetum cinerariifolium]
MKLDEHVPVHVLKPEHPEYRAPLDDDIQVENDDEDPEEDPSEEHEPKDDDKDPKDDPNEEHEPKDEDTKEPSEDSEETELFKEDKTVVTPSPPRYRKARIFVRPQTPMAASTQALINAFSTRSSLFPLPPTGPAYDHAPLGHRTSMIRMRDDIPEEDMPPRRRFILTAPPPRCDVAESSAATRAPRSQMITSIEKVNFRVSYQAQVRRQESANFYTQFLDARTDCRDIRLEIDVRQSAKDLVVTQMMRIHALEAKAQTDTVEDASSSCDALTWWNGHVRTLGHDAAYAMTWGTLKKKLTDKYCPKGEIKKLEIELWNLRTEKVDKYISGLPGNIHGNVMSARPKTLDETIELANDLIDQKLYTYAERQNENKRKADDTSRNNQQQPHKKQNVARAYTVGLGEKKVYTEDLPLCTKCNYHHTGQCVPKCGKCKSENGVAEGRSYALGGRGANLDSNVITCMFLLNNCYAKILFDTGVDRSFVSTTFSALIDITPTTLENHYDVELANRKIIRVNTIVRGCTLNFMNHPFNIDLMPVLLGSFSIIIGIDWLTKYHGVIICDEKIVHVPFGRQMLIFQDNGDNQREESRLNIVSNYNPKGERFLIASRFPTPPLACAFFSPGATVIDCSCSKGSVEDKILVPKPPKNCASTNVVNALREPFVVKKDQGVNPSQIDICCCECGDALDGIFCQQCICKSCGKGAHIGYNCPPKVPIISNPKPCNQTINNEPPQTLPSFDPPCYSEKEKSVPCVSKPNFVDEYSNIFNPPPQPPIYSCEFCGSNAQYGHYCTPQAPFNNPEPGYSQDLNFP